MTNPHIDTLELELRKLEGVRTVGFSNQHDVLYIQLFVEGSTSDIILPFEATRIAQRYSNSPVAVELVRWNNIYASQTPQVSDEAASAFERLHEFGEEDIVEEPVNSYAGSIGNSAPAASYGEDNYVSPSDSEENDVPYEHSDAPMSYDDTNDVRDEPYDFVDMSNDDSESVHEDTIELEAEDEIDLTDDDVPAENAFLEPTDIEDYDSFETAVDSLEAQRDRIILLTVTTSSENDEIEVHLAYNDMRTIGRAPTNRGLLGAIDATVAAIAELTGSNGFHAEWARSLEPGAEHASLVAVGLTSDTATDTRHGIAGGSSPIDAAARATLNALNRTATLANS